MSALKPPGDSKSPPSPAQSSKSISSARRRTSNSRSNPTSRLSHLFSPASAPLPPTISDSHSSSVSPSPTPISQYGASSSEEALARQLDRDAGGERMGLRSRRSSSATIRTLRNMGRQGSESAVVEEPEAMEPEAGPSRLAIPVEALDPMAQKETVVTTTSPKGKGKERENAPPLKVNPKKSMTWQRWNNSPSFPKANVINSATFEPPLPALPLPVDVVTNPEPEVEPPDPVQPTDSPAAPIEVEKPPEVNPSPTIPPPSKSWWFQSKRKAALSNDRGSVEKSTPVIVDIEGLNATTVEPIPSPNVEGSTRIPAERQEPAAETRQDSSPTIPSPLISTEVAVAEVPSNEPATEPALEVNPTKVNSSQDKDVKDAIGSRDELTASPSDATSLQTGTSRWYNYLGFPTAPAPQQPENTPTQDQKPQDVTGGVPSPALERQTPTPQEPELAVPTPSTPLTVEETTSSAHDTSTTHDTSAEESQFSNLVQDKVEDTFSVGSPNKPGNKWGGYIYSLVIPQIGEPSSSRASSITSRRPVENTTSEVKVDPAVEQKPVHETLVPMPEPELLLPVVSQTSTPKTEDLPESHPTDAAIPHHAPAPASWLTYLTSRAAQKTISNGASVTSSKKGRTGSNATEEVMDMSNDADFPSAFQASQAMPPPQGTISQRKKRLSIASKASSQGVSARQSMDTPPAVSSTAPSGPVTPPNFVVPSFDDTFNRPPRSLAPVVHEIQPTAQSPGGLTAGAAGLAWKAWGTASSYVYGGVNGSQTVTADEHAETRGKKEGRDVGGDLPRPLRETPGQESWRGVKRVVVFGVHGWFPAKMLNSLIGEPTGTSTKFATMMGAAVKSFLAERGVTDIRLTIIPLEGEGTIESRVDRLYKAYLSSPSYINDTRRADAIFFAAHSQGCIVTTHLISRLIAQGHIRTANNADAVARCEWAFGPVGIMPPDPRKARLGGIFNAEDEGTGRQKVAMLSMCGVHLGPFYSLNSSNVIQPYLQWFENNAARELFEFQDTLSPVSQAYHKALAMILDNEVKVLLLSSLNDQVVPIYSSSFSTASHPLLLRALYVDGASYSTSDFMTKLITFALMLRNAGIDDEGLIGHLSEATAGGLTGIGHSTPYESAACYELAVDYLFRSGPARHPLPPLEVESFTARDAKNDFELPWILRALTDAAAVKDLFPAELRELKDNVVSWRPVTKALKDIKKRLEPMAGKQSRLRSLNHSASSSSLVSSSKEISGTSPSGQKHTLGESNSTEAADEMAVVYREKSWLTYSSASGLIALFYYKCTSSVSYLAPLISRTSISSNMSARSSLISYLQYRGISVEAFSQGEQTLLGYLTVHTEGKQVYFETTNYSFPLSHDTHFCLGDQYDPLIIDAGEPKQGSGSQAQEEQEAQGLQNIWEHADDAQQASLLTILRVLEEEDGEDACIHSISEFAATLRS